MSTTETAAAPETRAFQAETKKLLDIVIHSLYSEKEVFLRELISNASDALDRRRVEALTDEALAKEAAEPEIRLEVDKTARTLSIADNGIGMSRDEVIANLGTIAKSGTRELLDRLTAAGGAPEAAERLIGQFGVGFYSAFMVADRVTVVTRRAGDEKATVWESTGGGDYTLAEGSRFHAGTTVTLHLAPVDEEHGLADFADLHVLKRIVRRYSDFVAYPVRMKVEREENEYDADGKPIPDRKHKVEVDETLNSRTPLWARPRSEVKDEELAELYRHVSHDWGEPLDTLWLKAEGRLEYSALLFIPSKAPFDLFYREGQRGLRLYVRRVLILDHCEDLLAPYLRFVSGVVECDDLPLNVSREMVQQDRTLQQMKRWLSRKVLEHLGEMASKEEAKYRTFWSALGRVILEGVATDAENRDRLLPLLRFPSSHHASDETSLADYVARMKTGQDDIWYLAGDGRAAIEASPHLETFKVKEIEVLYLVDPVAEFAVGSLDAFEGKKLRSAAEGKLELGTAEEREKEEQELADRRREVEGLLGKLRSHLEEWVEDVRLSTRLTASPAVLVRREHDLPPHFERLLRQTEGGAGRPRAKRILELNPKHPVLARLESRFAAAADDPALADAAYLLFGTACLADGEELPDPGRYQRVLAELMGKAL